MSEETQLLPIVIDTNVFVHLLNPEKNVNKHISQLLVTLQDTHQLQIDKDERIKAEYAHKLSEAIKNASDLGIEKYILEIWIYKKSMCLLEEEPPDNLRNFVKQVINDPTKRVDRYLVETAALSDCDLVTNDETDILNNAQTLKKELKKMKGVKCKNIRFMSSQDAWGEYCPIS
jgi:predicted nucleic acid-binding protein